MIYRAALPDDSGAIAAFLEEHSDTSMFLRANLAEYGPCGGDARNATQMWICGTGGEVTGVFGITSAGHVLVQFPEDAPPAQIAGILGATGQVRQVQALLGLADAETQLDEDEPLYSLALAHLIVPPTDNILRAAQAADTALLQRWRTAYLIETIHFSPEEAQEIAPGDVAAMIGRGSLMLLERPTGEPLAMTSFNAILPDMVQIGNVYAPPELRRRGHARDAGAQHLGRARVAGVKRAILFASGPAASRAYEAIGFRQIGRFTLLFFEQHQTVRPAA